MSNVTVTMENNTLIVKADLGAIMEDVLRPMVEEKVKAALEKRESLEADLAEVFIKVLNWNESEYQSAALADKPRENFETKLQRLRTLRDAGLYPPPLENGQCLPADNQHIAAHDRTECVTSEQKQPPHCESRGSENNQ